MSYDIYFHNTNVTKETIGRLNNVDIITVDLDKANNVMNIIYRAGYKMDCITCTSFRCVEPNAPEFYPLRNKPQTQHKPNPNPTQTPNQPQPQPTPNPIKRGVTMLIKLWFKSQDNNISDTYITLEGNLILVEPYNNKLKAMIELDDQRYEVICNYVTTLPTS